MNKQEIVEQLSGNYNSVIGYINGLTAEEFLFSYEGKWTAGQQLNHLVICVKPLVQVFSMSTPGVEQNFGRFGRASITYELLLDNYMEKLEQGGKAPSRFLPEPVSSGQRAALCETLETAVKELCTKIENFTEEDLDNFNIPHPLLGNLTMREMLYNAIYHAEHHQGQAMRNLESLGV